MHSQVLINGLLSGLLLAVISLGFSLVYLPTRVFHIAMGGIFAFAPYLALALITQTGSWLLAILASCASAIVLSLLCEVGNHRILERKQASSGAHLVSSLGIFIVLVQVIALFWGNESQVLREGMADTIRLGPVILTRPQMLSGIGSAIILAGFYIWLRFSNLGLRFRALADNPTEFGLRGYNVHRYRVLAFAASGALTAAGSLMMAYDVGFDPHGGLHVIFLAVVAVIIGGRDSFLGPIVGGLLLGVLRSQVVWYFSARWQDVFTFVFLALFLYVRPQGVCASASRLEEDE